MIVYWILVSSLVIALIPLLLTWILERREGKRGK